MGAGWICFMQTEVLMWFKRVGRLLQQTCWNAFMVCVYCMRVYCVCEYTVLLTLDHFQVHCGFFLLCLLPHQIFTFRRAGGRVPIVARTRTYTHTFPVPCSRESLTVCQTGIAYIGPPAVILQGRSTCPSTLTVSDDASHWDRMRWVSSPGAHG